MSYKIGLMNYYCEDCGAMVVECNAHTQYHEKLNQHAEAIAKILTSHIGPRIHNKYDLNERLKNNA